MTSVVNAAFHRTIPSDDALDWNFLLLVMLRNHPAQNVLGDFVLRCLVCGRRDNTGKKSIQPMLLTTKGPSEFDVRRLLLLRLVFVASGIVASCRSH
jgi:hypothetical protein